MQTSWTAPLHSQAHPPLGCAGPLRVSLWAEPLQGQVLLSENAQHIALSQRREPAVVLLLITNLKPRAHALRCAWTSEHGHPLRRSRLACWPPLSRGLLHLTPLGGQVSLAVLWVTQLVFALPIHPHTPVLGALEGGPYPRPEVASLCPCCLPTPQVARSG